MKIIFGIAVCWLTVLCFGSCDQFDEDEINKKQTQLIMETLGQVQKMGKEDPSGKTVAGFVQQNLAAMNQMMLAAGEVYEKQNKTPIINEMFKNVSRDVYANGVKIAFGKLATYSNATDKPLAMGKFAVTSAVIRWRCELDQERRKVHPTPLLDEKAGWESWHKQTNKTVDTLVDLIPKLEALGSQFWAEMHQYMLDYIRKGVKVLDQQIGALKCTKTRAKVLSALVENLSLLNTVASSRPPVAPGQ